MEVNYLTRIERNLEIKTSPKKIYEILNNDELETVWNIIVSESTEIATDKYSIKSTVGDFISTITERVENEKISYSMEGSAFSKMGYIVTPKGDGSEVTIWAEIEDEKQEKMLLKAAEILLEGLKKFADFMEKGGNPAEFDKKKK
jgi:hypothetical protein